MKGLGQSIASSPITNRGGRCAMLLTTTRARDPEMHQTKKGNQWYFGMKAHIALLLGFSNLLIAGRYATG